MQPFGRAVSFHLTGFHQKKMSQVQQRQASCYNNGGFLKSAEKTLLKS